MARWGMVIDRQRCIACYSCMISCRIEHFLPPGIFWNRVVVAEEGKFPAVQKSNLPVLCNHCKEAACIKACPTGATKRRDDGIVTVDSTKCVGCRYCLVACPYQQRTYVDDVRELYAGQGLTQFEILGRQRSPCKERTVVKCTFCAERIDDGRHRGLRPGIDRDATPACVIACPAKARYFGDLDDPDSEVSRLVREKKATSLHTEYGTEPSVYYIGR